MRAARPSARRAARIAARSATGSHRPRIRCPRGRQGWHDMSMRVVTLNTWGIRGDWTRRLMAFQDGLRALNPDIVTLQETVLTDEVDQAAEMLGDGYHLAQQQKREIGRAGVPAGQGITTASKWPFGRVFEVDFHLTDRTSDFACTCLVTEVLAPPPWGRVWVANHFPDYQLDHER